MPFSQFLLHTPILRVGTRFCWTTGYRGSTPFHPTTNSCWGAGVSTAHVTLQTATTGTKSLENSLLLQLNYPQLKWSWWHLYLQMKSHGVDFSCIMFIVHFCRMTRSRGPIPQCIFDRSEEELVSCARDSMTQGNTHSYHMVTSSVTMTTFDLFVSVCTWKSAKKACISPRGLQGSSRMKLKRNKWALCTKF